MTGMGRRTWDRPLPLALVAAAILTAQSFDPREIRVSAVPYHPKPGYALNAEGRLVEVGVVVRDGNGHPVSGLRKSDFAVWDNGKRHEITAFSVQSSAPAVPAAATPALPSTPADGLAPMSAPPPAPAKPRFIAVVFDDISMPLGDLYHAKAAAKRFLKLGMAPADRLAVLTVSSGLVLPFTADKAALSEAIDKVVLREKKQVWDGCPSFTPFEAYVTANHLDSIVINRKARELVHTCGRNICPDSDSNRIDITPPCAAALAIVIGLADSFWTQVRMQSVNTILTLRDIVDFMAQVNGTRVILLASSGFLAGTLEADQDQVINRALRAGVVINSLDAKGLYVEDTPARGLYGQLLGTRPQDATNEPLAYLANGTGGLFFHNNNDLDLGFRKLGMQPETSYLLAYVPDPADGKYHELKVSLTEKRHETVQARKGYLAVAAPEERPASVLRIDQEVLGSDQLNEVPVTVTARPDKLENGRLVARLAFQWDAAKMRFQLQDGARSEKLRVVAALLDGRGNFVTGKEGVVEFALSESTFARALSGGLNMSMSLEAPAGTYRLRTVVVEEGEAHVSANTQPVELK
jgi:VWFA-related protein